MKQIALLLLLIGFCCAADDNDAHTHVWDITGGIHGTADQVAKQINTGVEEAWTHYTDAESAVKATQAQLDSETATALKSVHDSAAYKTKLAAETQAEADLKKARDGGDAPRAIQVGGVVNQDKADLAAMERAGLAEDDRLPKARASLTDDIKKATESKLALNKAAEWRSRIVHSIRFGATLDLPLVHDQEFCVNSVKVADESGQTLTIAMDVREEVPGSVQKNARGDGLDVATYNYHPIHLIIPKPAKCTATKGATVNLKSVYRLSGDFDHIARIPTIHAEPDDDGKLAVLLATVSAAKGPDKTYLDGIDDAVDKKEAKALEEIDKQRK